MDIICPECGNPLDIDGGWDFMEDDGDTIVCYSVIECDCGQEVCVKAYFNWDGMYDIS